jgi:hypothetical protein
VKHFIRTSTTEFVLPNFSGVIDTTEINVTPLKSQTDFTSPFSSVKGKIQQKYFNGKVLEAEKVEGCLDLNFGPFKLISSVWLRIFTTFTLRTSQQWYVKHILSLRKFILLAQRVQNITMKHV